MCNPGGSSGGFHSVVVCRADEVKYRGEDDWAHPGVQLDDSGGRGVYM